jgi:hypothetical protein
MDTCQRSEKIWNYRYPDTDYSGGPEVSGMFFKKKSKLENESLKSNFNDEIFGFDGTVYVYVTDVIELMKRAWLNISII